MTGAIAMDMLDDQHRHHRADLCAGSEAGSEVDEVEGGEEVEDGSPEGSPDGCEDVGEASAGIR